MRARDWGGELRDPDGAAAEVRDWTGAGGRYDRTATSQTRDRARTSQIPDQLPDRAEAAEGHIQTGTSQTRDRNGASDTRDATGTAEVRDQTATNQTHHQTSTAEYDDRTGTSQTRDRARTSQIPDQLPDRAEAAEGHIQTATSQTRDRNGASDTRDQPRTSQTSDQTGTDDLRPGSKAAEPSIRSRSSQLPRHETEFIVLPDCAVDRWAAEARILLAAEGRTGGVVLVRLGGRQRLVLELAADDDLIRPVPIPSAGTVSALPVLPDAATWVLPDLQLLRAGAIEAERLHPLVAAALAPDRAATGPPRTPDRPGRPRLVECRGARHRIGLVDGVLAPLDHDPDEIRREELLVALTGTPLPCLQAIDEAHRRPHCLAGVRERLVHGDTAGALAVVEGLLGPEALLRTGPLRDELEAAALRRITYGLFRAGLTGPGPTWFRPRPTGRDSRNRRTHPRHAT
ncbi:hypothetical protein [Streptomyces canus]